MQISGDIFQEKDKILLNHYRKSVMVEDNREISSKNESKLK